MSIQANLSRKAADSEIHKLRDALSTKSDNLLSVPRIHSVEENQLLLIVL